MPECIYEHDWIKRITCDNWARRKCSYCGKVEKSELNWMSDDE